MRFTLAAALICLAAPALANGVAPIAAAPAPVVVQEEDSWTGFYAGGQLGLGQLEERQMYNYTSDYDTTEYGIFGGFRHDFGRAVIGFEADFMAGSADRAGVAPGVTVTIEDADYELVRLGVEAGVDLGQFLVYGTVGYTDISLDYEGDILRGSGGFYGIGADYRLTDRITVGAEALQADYHFEEFSYGVRYLLSTFAVNVAVRF
jgi:opacity protein-like surface antigen